MGHSANTVRPRKMKSFIVLNMLLSVYVGGQSSRPPRPSQATGDWTDWECCKWKVVGGKKYRLVGYSDDTWDYGCTSDCTYMTEGSDTKYCFKPGSLESECYYDDGGSKPPITRPPGSRPPMTGPTGSRPPMTGQPTGSRPPMTGEPTQNPGSTGSPGGCVCPAVFSPVCGASNQTFSNSCEAGCQNEEVDCQGSCPCPDCVCIEIYQPVC